MSAHSAKDKPIKVLWLTSSYPRSKDDSASVFLRYMAQALAKQQIELQILAPDHPDVEATPTADSIVIRRFHYFFPRKCQKLAYGSGILPNLRAMPWLVLQVPLFILSMFITATWLLLRQRPALIHAHWIFPQGSVAVLLGKLFRIPVIVTTHGGDAFALKGSLLGAIKRWTIKNCKAWTSNTEATTNAVGSELPSPHIIPMGIDYRKFAAGDAQNVLKENEPRKFILLFVGRLVEKKGVADLLKAYALLPETSRHQAELWIIGDGAEREKLEALAMNSRIVNSIRFFGRMPNHQLPDYYAAADIFIAPSIIDNQGDTEGQGVMLLEAMASRVPVITTNVGGIGNVVTHGETGLLVSPGKPQEISDAIVQLINDKKLRETLSMKGYRAAQDYDWKKVAYQFIKLYSESKFGAN